jgi:hypothetical protein
MATWVKGFLTGSIGATTGFVVASSRRHVPAGTCRQRRPVDYAIAVRQVPVVVLLSKRAIEGLR